MPDTITDKDLISFLKRNKKIKETFGATTLQQSHETFYTRNIKVDALRDVTYSKETKRLSITFVPPERGVEIKHEMRIQRASPPILNELVNFLSYRNGGTTDGQQKA
jgi:hypothetical protein